MKYRALTSFVGVVSMAIDEVREIPDPAVADDLLKAGYIEIADEEDKPQKSRKKTPKGE